MKKMILHNEVFPPSFNLSQTKQIVRNEDNRIDSKPSSFYRVIISIALTILMGLILFLIFLSFLHNIIISTINITGNVILDNKELLQIIEIELPAPYFEVNTYDITARFEEHPLVYKANITKRISGKLDIFLERSDPVVGVLATVNHTQTPIYFDKYGKCVQVGVGMGIVEVPIISGIELVNPQVGVYLPDWLKALLLDIDTIKHEDLSLYNSVSEFSIHDKGQEYRIMEINFVDYTISFITELKINTKSLLELKKLANRISLSTKITDFDYFDIRQGVIIGKKRNTENE